MTPPYQKDNFKWSYTKTVIFPGKFFFHSFIGSIETSFIITFTELLFTLFVGSQSTFIFTNPVVYLYKCTGLIPFSSDITTILDLLSFGRFFSPLEDH